MKTIIHKAESRGYANYNWLETHYTFSFAGYYNPDRIHFGALRVLNDDTIDGGMGFDKHPHDNMEIITIPLEGMLEHKDSMGHKVQMPPNEVQVMSAGKGIFHSEYNGLKDKKLKLLQIWVFPEKKDIEPRYDQKIFDPKLRLNQWQRIVSPDESEALMINQQAWFSRAYLDKGRNLDYELHNSNNGVYLFVIEGSVDFHAITLNRRDAVGAWDTSLVSVTAAENAELLLMEIPMH